MSERPVGVTEENQRSGLPRQWLNSIKQTVPVIVACVSLGLSPLSHNTVASPEHTPNQTGDQPTPGSTPTPTLFEGQTPIATPTEFPTPFFTPTETHLPTPTQTHLPTPTQTITQTATQVLTPTLTNTGSPTPFITPTETHLPTPTQTPIGTPINQPIFFDPVPAVAGLHLTVNALITPGEFEYAILTGNIDGSLPVGRLPDVVYPIDAKASEMFFTYPIAYTRTEGLPFNKPQIYEASVTLFRDDDTYVTRGYPKHVLPATRVDGQNIACDPTAMPPGSLITCQIVAPDVNGNRTLKGLQQQLINNGFFPVGSQWKVGEMVINTNGNPLVITFPKPSSEQLDVVAAVWNADGTTLTYQGNTENEIDKLDEIDMKYKILMPLILKPEAVRKENYKKVIYTNEKPGITSP